MPDFFKKCHLNSKNALFYFKQNVQKVYVSVYCKPLRALIACCIVPSHWLEYNRQERNLAAH